MAAYTDTLGFNKGTAAFPAKGGDRLSFFEVKLDFADIVAARAAASATALAAGDTLQVINLPAQAIVVAAGLEVTSVESTNTTGTFDFGYTGGSPETAAFYVNDLANNALASASVNAVNLTRMTAADTIDLLINTAAPTDCVVRAWAFVLDSNGF